MITGLNTAAVLIITVAFSAGAMAAQHKSHAVHRSTTADAEMNMIQLQNVMSQRSVVVQVTTGMMNSISESQHNIIKNMGDGGKPPVSKPEPKPKPQPDPVPQGGDNNPGDGDGGNNGDGGGDGQ